MLAGCVTVRRQKQNHRLLWVQIRFTHSRAVGPEPKLTRAPRGLRRVRTGYAYQPPALDTYRRRRAACPQGPTYCTYWVRVPALGVRHAQHTVATQVSARPLAALRLDGLARAAARLLPRRLLPGARDVQLDHPPAPAEEEEAEASDRAQVAVWPDRGQVARPDADRYGQSFGF